MVVKQGRMGVGKKRQNQFDTRETSSAHQQFTFADCLAGTMASPWAASRACGHEDVIKLYVVLGKGVNAALKG